MNDTLVSPLIRVQKLGWNSARHSTTRTVSEWLEWALPSSRYRRSARPGARDRKHIVM
jgi:hypothetical protein